MRKTIDAAPAVLVALIAALLALASPASAAARGEPAGTAEATTIAAGAGYGAPNGSERVRSLQRRLRHAGERPGPLDGLFGPRTKAAVERFQGANGLAVDGVVGALTTAALDREATTIAPGAGYGRPHGSRRVRSLQRRLRRAGERPGPLDGLFGPRTEAAVERFQGGHGLAVDGIVGAKTRGALARRLAASAPTRRRTAAPGPGARSPRPRPVRAPGPPASTGPAPAPGGEAAPAPNPGGSGSEFPGLGLVLVLVGALALAVIWAALRPGLPDRRRPQGPGPAREPSPVPPPVKVAEPEPEPLPSPVGVAEPEPEPSTVKVAEPEPLPQPVGVAESEPEPSTVKVAEPEPQPLPSPVGVAEPEPEPSTEPEPEPEPLPSPVGVAEPDRSPRPRAGRAQARRRALEPEVRGREAPARARMLGYAVLAAGGGELDRAELLERAGAITGECSRRGFELVELVREREPRNGKGLTRPGLGYACARIAAGEARGLVVSELSELSRSAAELGGILEWFTRSGARLVAVAQGLDSDERAGRLAVGALVEVSRWERRRLSERTQRGLEAARRERRAGGRRAVADDPELRGRIARMRAEGMTLQAIADRLNEAGVPTVRGGAKWRPSSVHAAAGYKRRPRSALDSLPGAGANGEGAPVE
jgi:peptidoglycan hydrolase-like protein with peptidoglycan-binding domain/DNA invertase Pin-like site-specific DNA recombinase